MAAAHISTPVQLAKNMITNASFRAKKIATDIPKVTVDGVDVPEDGVGGGVVAVGGTGTGGLGGHGHSSRHSPNLTSMASIIEDREDSALLGADSTDNTNANSAKTPTKGHHESSGSNKAGSKLIAKLRKKTLSISDEAAVVMSTATESVSLKPRASFSKDKAKDKEKSEKKKSLKLTSSSPASSQPPAPITNDQSQNSSTAPVSSSQSQLPNSPIVLPPAGSASATASNVNGDSVSATSGTSNNSKDLDTLEKVEELIQMKKLPTETIAIHSPESGTTIF